YNLKHPIAPLASQATSDRRQVTGDRLMLLNRNQMLSRRKMHHMAQKTKCRSRITESEVDSHNQYNSTSLLQLHSSKQSSENSTSCNNAPRISNANSHNYQHHTPHLGNVEHDRLTDSDFPRAISARLCSAPPRHLPAHHSHRAPGPTAARSPGS
ncbi:hypothetical protein KC19_12G140600, partial [Ceratodon purpureus]